MKTVLGLDISSSTIGYALLQYDDELNVNLIDYGFIKPPKATKGSLAFRANEAMKKCNILMSKLQPNSIAIEAYASKFSAGRSTANTIITLSVVNEAVSIGCINTLGFDPIKYPVVTIRSVLSKYLSMQIVSKDDVYPAICNNFKSFSPPTNRKGLPAKEAGDIADAIAVALTHIIKEGSNGKANSVRKRGKRKNS